MELAHRRPKIALLVVDRDRDVDIRRNVPGQGKRARAHRVWFELEDWRRPGTGLEFAWNRYPIGKGGHASLDLTIRDRCDPLTRAT